MELSVITVTETNPIKVQHVNRKSSDQLLTKFAHPDVNHSKSTKRRRKSVQTSSTDNGAEIDGGSFVGLVERKRLLMLAPPSKQRSVFLRQLASGNSHLKNKSLVKTIRKTWRKTMEGASRVFIEKHYNRHRRLINDVVYSSSSPNVIF